MRKLTRFLSVFAMLTFLFAGAVMGQNLVQNTTQGTSYATIQAAIDDANSGDVIEVDATYTHNGLRSTIDGKNLTINGNNATIDGAIDIRGGAVVNLNDLTVSGIQNTDPNNNAGWSSVSSSGSTGPRYVTSVRGTGSELIADNYNIDQVGFADANITGIEVAQDAYVELTNSNFDLTGGNVYGFYLQNYNTEIDVDNTDFTLDPERDPVGLGNKNAIIIGAGVGSGDNSFPTIDITNYNFTPVIEGDQRAYKVQLYAAGANLTNSQINTWFDGLLDNDEKARVIYASASGWREYPSDVFNVTQGLGYYTIQGAIDEANADDVIEVADGTFTETLNLGNKQLTITGAGSSQTIIDAVGSTGYAIKNFADGTTIEDLQLINSQHYGFKVAGVSNITLTNILVENSAKTGIDLNGVNNATLTNVEINNTVGGFGLMIGNSNNITVNGVTTSNNAWAGVTVQSWGGTYTGGCDDIDFQGTFNASDTYPFLIEKDSDGGTYYPITNVTIPDQFDYIAYGFRSGVDYKQWFYAETLAEAKTIADGLATSSSHTYLDVTIYNIDETNYYVTENLLIQDAIDAASSGDVIDIYTGTYTEQLHITTSNLTINGEGTEDVIVKSPASLTHYYTTSNDNYPVVFVDGGNGCTIKNLTVDGDNQGNSNYRFQGIAYWNAGGTMENLDVINVMDSPFSGAQHGVAVYSYNNTGGPYSLNVSNVDVEDFQKNAFAINGDGLTVTMSDCDVVGAGPTDVTAQNGIQFLGDSDVDVSDCTIDAIDYTGDTWTASALLNFDATVVADNITITNSQTSVYNQGGDMDFTNGSITNPTGDAFYAYSPAPSAPAGNNSFPEAQPFDKGLQQSSRSSDIDVTISNSVFDGANETDSWGVSALAAAGATVSLEIDQCTISNWDYAIYAYDYDSEGGGIIDLEAHNNDLSPGNTYGFGSNDNEDQNANCNWWGTFVQSDIDAMIFEDGTGEIIHDNVLLNSTIDPTDPDYSCGEPLNNPVVNLNTLETYATIQAAIDDATAGDVIEVAPGTYAEQLLIETSIELRGSNYGVSGNEANRNSEAVITFPAGLTDYQDLVIIKTDDVTFDGFTFDGSNYTDENGVTGIIGYGDDIVIQNNIVSNFNYISVWVTSYHPDYPNPGGYGYYRNGIEIKDNYIHNADNFNATNGIVIGYGIYLQGTYGTVSGNVVEDTKDAIQVQPYNHPNTIGTTGLVSNNSFEGFREPVWFNYSENTNAIWDITNNTLTGIAAPTGASETEWRGFRIQTCTAVGDLEFSNNTINIGTADATALYSLKKFSNVVSGMIDLDATFADNNWERCVAITDGTDITGDIFYTSIQDAIDAAADGDIIEVNDGTYEEEITLNKPNITVQSVNGSSSTIIDTPDGTLTTSVTAEANMGTLVFDGFKVTGFTESGIIQGMSSATGTIFKVYNNEVIPADDYMRNGIEVSGDGSEIIGNTVQGAPLTEDWAGTALMVVNASNVSVESNTVTGDSDIGISVLNWDVAIVENITIDGNNISGADNGIRLSGYSNPSPHGDVSNVTIINNILENNERGINAQTIQLSDLTVTGNQISNNTNQGVRFSSTSATLSGDILINNNDFLNNTNEAIYNGASYNIDGTCNWFGSDDPTVIDAMVYGDVSWTPYLLTAEGPCGGDQPVHNTTQDIYYTTIQSAIDDANAGDVIEVAAGNYQEQVNIEEELSIIGSTDENNPSTILTPDPSAMVIYDHYGSKSPNSRYQGHRAANIPVVRIAASNVTFQNFTVDLNDQVFWDVQGSYDTDYSRSTAILVDHVETTPGDISTMEKFENVVIDNNIITNMLENDGGDAIKVMGRATGTISNNTIHAGSQSAISIMGTTQSTFTPAGPDFDIEYNTAYGGTFEVNASGWGFYGVGFWNNGEGKAYQNTIYNNPTYANIHGSYATYGLTCWGNNPGLIEFIENEVYTDGGTQGGVGAYQYRGLTAVWTDNIIEDQSVALEFNGASNCPTATVEGNTFQDCESGILAYGMSSGCGSLTINNNSFINISDLALESVNGDQVIDAYRNWWGDASGPFDDKTLPGIPDYNNPSGNGAEVSDYVDYDPWWEDAAMTELHDVTNNIPAYSSALYEFDGTGTGIQFDGNTNTEDQDVTVEFFGENPDGDSDFGDQYEILDAYWEITSTEGSPGNYEITFDVSGIPGIKNFALLRLLKREDASSDWTDIGTATEASLENYPELTWDGLSSFSQFAIANGDQIDIAVNITACAEFEVVIKPTSDIESGNNVTNLQFTVQWPETNAPDVSFTPVAGLGLSLQGSVVTTGGYNYATFCAVPFNLTSALSGNTEFKILEFTHDNSGSGTGTFEIMANDDANASPDNKFYAEYFGSDVTGINYANAEDVAFGYCPLTIGGDFTASDKTYDGNTAATIADDNLEVVTVVGDDDVSLLAGSYAAQFASKDVDTDIEVSIVDNNGVSGNLAGADASKYTLSFAGSPTTTADITAKSLTATITGNPTKVYDGTDVATLTSDDYTMATGVGTETITINKTSGTYASADVGDPIIVTVSLDNTIPTDDFTAGAGTLLSNYDLPDEATGNGAITEAPLTITADNQTMVYDGEVFPVGNYTVSYDGFVNGETSAVLGGTLDFSTGSSYTATAVGTYVITPSGLTSDNYDISFANGTLEITAVTFALKAMLQGPYDTEGSMMDNPLRTNNQLPSAQPFNQAPWNYSGTETLPAPVPTNAVDWVLAEFRDTDGTSYTVKGRAAGLIRKNGVIEISIDDVAYPDLKSGEDYYIVVWHRNHMPVMSATAETAPVETAFDFTASANLFGTNPAIELETGVEGLIAGDVTANGLLQYSGPGNDRGPIIAKIIAEGGSTLNDVISNGYWYEDVNLNNTVSYLGANNDRGIIITNLGDLTGNSYLNSLYESVVPGVYSSGSKDNSINDGPVHIRIHGNQLELLTNETINNGLIDNIQFTLAWSADDLDAQRIVENISSQYGLMSQGKVTELNGTRYQVYVTIDLNVLPDVWAPDQAVALLNFKDAPQGHIWIADDHFTKQHNGMYYVSIWGKDHTGTVYTGIETLNTYQNLNIYPNPVTDDYLMVQVPSEYTDRKQIEIIDAQGRSLYNQERNAHNGLIKIDVSGLMDGVYIIQLTDENAKYLTRFVIAK